MQPPVSERLHFRNWTDEDLPLALALWGDARVTALIGGPFEAQQIRAGLDAAMESQRAHGLQYWPCFLREGDSFVGCCGLRPRPDARCPELGFHLLPQYWGRGLAREAANAVIEYGFANFVIDGLFAGHHPHNVASARLLQRLGFQRTGEELYPPTGLMHPTYLLVRIGTRAS